MEKLLKQCSPLINQISSHPLFSILTTSFLLYLLYFPNFLSLLFSPVLITTSLIVTTLHLASPKPETLHPQKDIHDPMQTKTHNQPTHGANVEVLPEQQPILLNSNVEWGQWRGPLEVIYEEYEGEEEENDEEVGIDESWPEYSHWIDYYFHMNMMMSSNKCKGLECLSCCSSEPDARSDDECSNSAMRLRWGEDEEGMIEIEFEEDNLIELDLSVCR